MASSSTPADRNHGPHFAAGTCPIGFGCTMREKGGKKYEEKALLCGCLLPGAFSYGLRACFTGVGGGSGGAGRTRRWRRWRVRSLWQAPPVTQNIREWTASLRTAVPDRYSLKAGSRALHPRQAIMVSIIRPGVPLSFGGTGDMTLAPSGAAGLLGRNGGGQLVLHREAAAAAGITTKCISDGRAAAAHLTQARFLRTISFGISLNDKGEETT